MNSSTDLRTISGARTTVALQVATSMLADGWNNRDFVVWAMCKAADIIPKTARNRLDELVGCGQVEKRRTPTGRWQLRLVAGTPSP